MFKRNSAMVLNALIITAFLFLTFQPAMAAEPKYGGELIIAVGWDMARAPDPWYFNPIEEDFLNHVYERLTIGDWGKGPGGTKEFPFNSWYYPMNVAKGLLAESWSFSEDGLRLIVKLRQGVRFHDKPPVNGREMVATDVKFSFDRRFGTGSGFTEMSPHYRRPGMKNLDKVTAPDKYTVVFHFKVPSYLNETVILYDYNTQTYAPELIKETGAIKDWRQANGTGPYTIEDYVVGSTIVFKRNPNYYLEDELNPGNKLPYVERIKYVIMPEQTTQIAALRAGKIDFLNYSTVNWRDRDDILKTNRNMQVGTMRGGSSVGMYPNHQRKPFSDVRVRQALQMAIDIQAIRKLEGGVTSRLPSHISESFGASLYTQLKDYPAKVQEIYSFNPEKAKKLLKEAGYPKGFKTSTVTLKGNAERTEIIKHYWSQIGVDLKIKVLERGSFNNVRKSGDYDLLTYGYGWLAPHLTLGYFSKSAWWYTRQEDKFFNDAWEKVTKTVESKEQHRQAKALNEYITANVFHIQIIGDYERYIFAQPWVKGWHGEYELGLHNQAAVLARVWLDRK